MAQIQENVKLGSEIDNLMAKLISVVSDLDWILIEHGLKQISFREKSRFDHFSHLEGEVEILGPPDFRVMTVNFHNSGEGPIQEDYLRGKLSEFLLLLEDIITEDDYADGLEVNSKRSLSKDIENLSRLHQKGELSDEEFARAKEKLLND